MGALFTGRVWLTIAVLALVAASPASAAQTLGSTALPGSPSNCNGPQSFVQDSDGAFPYSPSASGVIVKWRYRAGADAPMVRLKVYTHISGDTFRLDAQSAFKQSVANTEAEFTESPGIPIAPTQRLGMTQNGQGQCNFDTGNSAEKVRGNFPAGDTSLGNNGFNAPITGARANISATVEPDADGDGFGDETQDLCPTVAATQGPCTPGDDDADGVPNSTDNCLLAANPDQANNDGDAEGDVCDADDDNDNVADGGDNCPLAANPDQANHDDDPQGDACDTDDDNDGILDAQDPFPLDPTNGGLEGKPTAGNDLLNGTAGKDLICGLGGDDKIDGLQGNDTIYGDQCNAKLLGAAAADDGDDRLTGAQGNDKLYGSGGNDTLLGEGGNDLLSGGGGKNSYSGGGGNDTVLARNKKKETVNCGKGRKDRATVDRKDRVKGCEKVKRPKK